MLIPATTATVKSVHSPLNLDENDLCSTMIEDCLNNLMLLYIHKGMVSDYKIIIFRIMKQLLMTQLTNTQRYVTGKSSEVIY